MNENENTPEEPTEDPIASPNPALEAAAGANERMHGEKGVWMQATVLPIALIGVYLLVTGVAVNVYGAAAIAGGFNTDAGIFDAPLALLAAAIVLCVAEIFVFRFLVGRLGKRPVVELEWAPAVRELLMGAIIGVVLISVPMLILWLSGHWRLDTAGWRSGIGLGIAMGLMACVWEELLFRGVMFRLFDLAWGPVWAIVMTTIVFGGLHIMNPGMNGLTVVALALSGGPLLGAAYLWKRRLWLPIGLHFGWNAAQGSLWGVAISGTGEQKGLLDGVFVGPEWLTGGTAGLEGSALTAVIALVAAALILLYIRNHTSNSHSETEPGTNLA